MDNTINKYTEELKQDVKVDKLTIFDVQSALPAIKHKWVSRYINHKQELDKLYRLLKKAKEKTIEELKQSASIALTLPILEKKAEEDVIIKEIYSRIKEQELICLYLEKVEKIFQTMTYDIKNMIDIMKLEEL